MNIKNILFMAEKFFTDLKRPRQAFELSKDLHSSQLGYYYFNFQERRIAAGKDQKLISRFDDDGIPLNKTYIDVTDKDYVYFPISIGQMGLAVYHTFLQTGLDKDKARFLKFGEWFYKNAELNTTTGARWLTDVSLPAYRNPGPWQSAFSQSRGISILLRAGQLSGKKEYYQLAEKALIPFTVPVDQGGVTSYTEWGPFYEEYTASVPTLVLNGMIFSLCGLYDFIRVFPGNVLARKLFDDGIQTLENILPNYNMGFWSKYNLCRADWYPVIDPATVGYQRLHATQLHWLYVLTGKETFKTYRDLFRKQDNILNAVRMYAVKYKALKTMNRL